MTFMAWMAASVVFLLQLAALATQQQPARGSIEGVVERAGTGEPIAGAEIRVMRVAMPVEEDRVGPRMAVVFTGSDPFAPVPAITDREGHFLLKDLEPGSYKITAARNGYAKQEYGQRIPAGQGTVVTLAGGQTLKDVAFYLIPGGTISGRVRDDGGEPITGARVELLRATYVRPGKRDFRIAGSALTDDRGEYRLYWITPGRYYLKVDSQSRPGNSTGRSDNEVAPKPYPPMLYPGTADPEKASVIAVEPGTDLAADFVLASQRLYRIGGKVIDPTISQPPQITEVKLGPRQPGGFSNFSRSTVTNPTNGNFEFRDIPPGLYWLSATMEPNVDAPITPNTTSVSVADLLGALVFSRPAAHAAIDVSGSDIENLVLPMTRGFSIRGRVRVEDRELATINGFETIHVELASAGPGGHEQLPRPMSADGAFSLDNVFSGEYRLMVHVPPDLYVKDARLDGADVINEFFQVSGPVSGILEIVLSSRAGQINGTLVNEKSQPVPGIEAVMVPDRFRDRADLIKTAVTDKDGRFTIRGIPPGEYKIFAWEAIEQFAYFDPDVLRQFEQLGKAVSIPESGKITLEVKLIPAQQ